MLYVNFTRGSHAKIRKHERMPFPQAVEISHEIEMEMRGKGEKLESYFYVIDTDYDEAMYEGHFTFGSYQAANLFLHIKKQLPKIRVNKERERIRLAFIADLEESVDERYKIEEEFDPNEKNLEWDKVSRLKKWQRRTVYGLTGFFAVTSVCVPAYFFIQLANLNQSYHASVANAEESKEVLDTYEGALLGNDEALYDYLDSLTQEEMSDAERNLYAGFVADAGEFEQLNTLFDQDHSLVASFLSIHRETETLQAYHEEYPTNEAMFDIAYVNEEFEEVTTIEDVDITQERSKKRANAFLQIGNAIEAESELSRFGATDQQANALKAYTTRQIRIDEINQEMDHLDEEEDEDAFNELKGERAQLEEEQNRVSI